MRKPTIKELQEILDSGEHYTVITNPDGSISAVLSDTLKPTVTIADIERMMDEGNPPELKPDGSIILKDKTNLGEADVVAHVMRSLPSVDSAEFCRRVCEAHEIDGSTSLTYVGLLEVLEDVYERHQEFLAARQ